MNAHENQSKTRPAKQLQLAPAELIVYKTATDIFPCRFLLFFILENKIKQTEQEKWNYNNGIDHFTKYYFLFILSTTNELIVLNFL